jgi:hypothetical protein
MQTRDGKSKLRTVVDVLMAMVGGAWLSAAPAFGQVTSPLSQSSADSANGVFTVPVGGSLGIPTGAPKESSGTAILGVVYEKQDKYFFSGFFNLGSAQTVRGSAETFGTAVLNPAAEGRGVAAAGSYTLLAGRDPSKWLLGGGVRFGYNAASWEVGEDGEAQTISGGVMYLSAVVQFGTRTLPFADDNRFRVTLEAGYTWRAFAGNLAQTSGDVFRANPAVLGVADRNFGGLEFAFLLNLNDVQPFIRFTHFGATGDVPGFSGNQVVLGVNMLTPLFKSK